MAQGAFAVTVRPTLFGLGIAAGASPGDVRFTPESGHSEGGRKTSAFDPKRTLPKPDVL